MKRPSRALLPRRTTSSCCTATTAEPGEAVMIAPATFGLDASPPASLAPAGGGASVGRCAPATPAGIDPLGPARGGAAQTGVAGCAPAPGTGKRPLTIAASPLINDRGVPARSRVR